MIALPDITSFDVGMLVVCLKQYTPHTPGHLDINPGEIIEGRYYCMVFTICRGLVKIKLNKINTLVVIVVFKW